jgi:hypothetical protein
MMDRGKNYTSEGKRNQGTLLKRVMNVKRDRNGSTSGPTL